MKIILSIVVSIFFLVSCASITPTQFVGPNGKKAYSMKCSGLGRTLEACYQKSDELCPSGYNIINSMSGTVAVPTASGGILAAPSHNIAIECK